MDDKRPWYRFTLPANSATRDLLFFSQRFPGDDGGWQAAARWRRRMADEIRADMDKERTSQWPSDK